MFIPPPSPHHCHHLLHAAFRLHPPLLRTRLGLSRPPCRSACGLLLRVLNGRKNKQLAWTKAISHKCARIKSGQKGSARASGGRSGQIRGSGIGRSIAGTGLIGRASNGRRKHAVGGSRSLPPCVGRPAAPGKRTRTRPRFPWSMLTRTWAPTA